MKIKLANVGKRFNKEWIFRHIDYEFSFEKSYAIVGPNGSGKSTLLQIIAGATAHSEGEINYLSSGNILTKGFYSYLSISAPYLELVEEMTLSEFLYFHSSLKNWIPSLTSQQIIAILHLQPAAHKQIRYFSSGMKQRLKLGQAIFSDVPVILLDEPCTNLDEEGMSLYKNLIAKYCKNRTLIVSSNDRYEYDFCEEKIDMQDYKCFTKKS